MKVINPGKNELRNISRYLNAIEIKSNDELIQYTTELLDKGSLDDLEDYLYRKFISVKVTTPFDIQRFFFIAGMLQIVFHMNHNDKDLQAILDGRVSRLIQSKNTTKPNE